jgi:transcription termination/antitermination protein NusG
LFEPRFATKGVLSVNIGPESSNPENQTADESSFTSPASADTTPVMVPGAPPPPTPDAVDAGKELVEEGTQDTRQATGENSRASGDASQATGDRGPETGKSDEQKAAAPLAAGEPPTVEWTPQHAEPEVAEEQGKDDEDTAADEPELPFAPPLELIDETVADEDLQFDWYILKVQVNREDSIKDALLRNVKRNGLDRYFREIVVPTEDVVEFTKAGKKRVVKKKLYPGYILVNMAVSDESWFMVRETPGIGDFTGSAGKPTPMDPKDVERILRSSKVLPEEEGAVGIKTTIPFKQGDRVRVKEGYFQNFEGDVDAIDQANGRVTVMINIFGRSTPVELEHWQIEMV